MARVLISTMPATGHVNPALPLATELVRRGHEVVWHTGRDYAGKVAATGSRFAPFRAAPDFEQIPVTADEGAKGMAVGVSLMRRLFIDRLAGQVADYEEILKEFPADVVLADMCSLGADALHAKGGPVYATLGINPLVTFDPEIPPFGSHRPPATTVGQRLRNRVAHQMTRRIFMPAVTRLLNAERVRLGLSPLPDGRQLSDVLRSPYLHLMPTTEAFEYPRANLEPQIHFVGPLLPAPPAAFTPPAWWAELEDRPVVHVTQGTYATDPTSLIRPTVNGLAGEDVLVVATGPGLDRVGPLPSNVRTGAFIPHAQLLPYVDAMVTNAGYNGVLTALSHGVPLICAGRSEDKANTSARVAWSGSGIDLKTDTPAANDVREAVGTVLATPSYRENARRIQADFARHDPPAEASSLLEQLARDKALVARG
ncbi:MAG TPA: nucleotide disphospho-sugar-binding domain-containing protein [Micromonosporaceae bacterium]